MKAAWIVFCKEIVDALRDRKTLTMVLLSSVLMGPLMMVAMSALVASLEAQAETRAVSVVGLEHAPSLRNFLERHRMKVTAAPADYAKQLQDSKLGSPVIRVGAGFEQELLHGEQPTIEVVTSSSNQRASVAADRISSLMQQFNHEQGALRMMVRGVSPAVLQAVQVQERDLASPASRAAQLTMMLPFFIIMAVMYGAQTAALDATAGERERGSLEPLLMNPTPRLALVIGKWGAVAALGMMVASLSSLSFLPSQWIMRSEMLAAMFQYEWSEALWFLGLLLPLAGLSAAAVMAVAIRSKTFKESQATSTILIMVISMLPMVTVFSQQGEQGWWVWLPGLAQSMLMNRVLKGEALSSTDYAVTLLVCALGIVLCLLYVAQQLRQHAIRG